MKKIILLFIMVMSLGLNAQVVTEGPSWVEFNFDDGSKCRAYNCFEKVCFGDRIQVTDDRGRKFRLKPAAFINPVTGVVFTDVAEMCGYLDDVYSRICETGTGSGPIDLDTDPTNELYDDTPVIANTELINIVNNLINQHIAQDLDIDTLNEIQALSINGDTIFLSDGGFVVIDHPTYVDNDTLVFFVDNGVDGHQLEDEFGNVRGDVIPYAVVFDSTFIYQALADSSAAIRSDFPIDTNTELDTFGIFINDSTYQLQTSNNTIISTYILPPSENILTTDTTYSFNQLDQGNFGFIHEYVDEDGVLTIDTVQWNYCEILESLNCQAPLALKDCGETQPNVPIDINALFNDIAVDSDIDITSIAFENGGVGNQGGTYTVDMNGLVTYDPPLNYIGNDTIYYTIYDQEGNVSNLAPIVIIIDGILCPTCSFTLNDNDGYAQYVNNTDQVRIRVEALDAFGGALTSTDIITLKYTNCADGSSMGDVTFAGDDLNTPTGGDADLIAAFSTYLGTTTLMDFRFDKRNWANATNMLFECSIELCVQATITNADCGEIESTNNTVIYRSARTVGHYSALAITDEDAASNQSNLQHVGTTKWLSEDANGSPNCVTAGALFSSGWPGLAPGITETSDIWYTQESGSVEGVVDAINGNNLVKYDGLCPGFTEPTGAGVQFNGVCGSPNYTTGSTGDGYIVVDGVDSDGHRSVSTGYMTTPNSGANKGSLYFRSTSSIANVFFRQKTRTTTTYQFYSTELKSGVYASDNLVTTTINIYKEGVIDAVTNTIPVTTTVTGGTLLTTQTAIANASGLYVINFSNVDVEFYKKYQFEIISVYSSGKEIRNIHEVTATPYY